MALETWLIKVKAALVGAPAPATATWKKGKVGVLCFEIAGLMSKLLHLWQSLSDSNIDRLRHHSLSMEGVRKIVSNDDAFLLGLARAEMAHNLTLLAASLSTIAQRCHHPDLRRFHHLFAEFADTGRDPHYWLLGHKEMEGGIRKMKRLVAATASLHREMEELSAAENSLQKWRLISKESQDASIINVKEQKKMVDLEHKIFWRRQEVKYLKQRSLWNRTFDSVTSLLARSIFTVLSRIKLVFGIDNVKPIPSLPRSPSTSATVHPSDQNLSSIINSSNHDNKFNSNCSNMKEKNEELNSNCPNLKEKEEELRSNNGILTIDLLNSKQLKPPATTLGAAALAVHYANLIIVLEKMTRSPQLVGAEARDDLYSMLPSSVRRSLRRRLRGVGFSGGDPILAGEWREALGRILGWLSPLAHNMMKWQSERSFEQQNLMHSTSNLLLLQTLYFADKEKTEAAITELLVGLNYIWRFEREKNAKALFESCTNNINGVLKLHNSSS